MTCLLGYGLPSSLTPERIRKVLGFARSQEREFEATLDGDTASILAQTDPGDNDLYRRLHSLLRTAHGREAYGKARHDFERSKPKRLGRADFFVRLTRDCLQEVLDPEMLATTQHGECQGVATAQDCKDALARAEAWERLAEFVWALSAGSKVGDGIVDVLREHPEVAPFLDEVRAGLVSVDDPTEGPEEDGEAARLVENIRGMVAPLDAEHLEPAALDDLHGDIRRLVAITRLRENRRRDTGRLQSQLSTWQEATRRRLEDLEIGDMAVQAQQFRALETEQRRLDWLRRVRNALAHNEIVPWGTLVSPVALQIVDFRE